jgi:hypothetical protein
MDAIPTQLYSEFYKAHRAFAIRFFEYVLAVVIYRFFTDRKLFCRFLYSCIIAYRGSAEFDLSWWGRSRHFLLRKHKKSHTVRR